MDRHARPDRAVSGVRYSFDRKIPVPADEKVNGMPATSRGHRRTARWRDRVRVRHARLAEGRALGTDRPHALGCDDELLDSLRTAIRRQGPASGRSIRVRRGRCCTSMKRFARRRRAAVTLRGARCPARPRPNPEHVNSQLPTPKSQLSRKPFERFSRWELAVGRLEEIQFSRC